MNSWIRSVVVLVSVLLLPCAARAAEPTKQECVAANDAAQDLRRAGWLRESREKLALCVSTSCPGPVREDCAQRISEVDAAMPSLVFEVKNGNGSDLSAVHVTMDGRPTTDTLDGSALPVDPGEHRFAFEDGSARVERTIIVREGDKNRHVRVTLGAAVAAPGETTQTMTSSSPMPAIVSFGIGGTGLVVGTVFAIEGATAKSQANSACGPAGNQCPGDASSRNGAITTDTVVAVAGFGVAAAGAVLGALLLPHNSPSEPKVGRRVFPVLGLGYAGVGGSF